PGQLGDALDQVAHRVAELRADVLDLDAGVLDGVVEERSGDRRLVHPEPGEDLRDAPRMVDELLPRATHLTVVALGCEAERPHHQVAVEGGLVRLKLREQVVDKILVSCDYRHPHILPGSGPVPSPDRNTRRRGEPLRSMFRRRRTAYRIRLAARLLLAIGR